ncbi:FAD-dependent oxidoreductase [Desulfatitalea sp. M08but]|uniref:FAD-dependent oxidoreductase n=1 Tax=Desulfatitalea alkaliphila TaxID=2929485 RepID=A0AA41UHJ4_9BACT|nr:FAD-dependent oxidoreductase [Desulfatitalea alkaliphila]
MEIKTTGAVMIVGGGVAGIQAALDLADSGFLVYLVEKTPAIGGAMGQLDKTFPTIDCSMCILSPQLVATGRHPNIELVTCADVERVAGRAGRFRVQVRKRARSIDMDRCTGCRACVDACPVISAQDEIAESITTM